MGHSPMNGTDLVLVWVLLIFGGFIAYMVLGYLVTNKKLKPPFLEPAERLYTFVSACLALLFFGGIAYLAIAYYFTESGWYPRTREVNVYCKAHDWVNGELQTCYSFKSTDKTADGELTALSCSANDESHLLNVKFWGPITADGEIIWKCERLTFSITCKLK